MAAEDSRGPSWIWAEDPTLRITLSADPAAPGLLVEHGDRDLAVDADWGQGPVRLPLLLVFGRSDGTDPLAADDSPGLHLLLAGSPEHGCPEDDLELDLLPRLDGDQIVLDVEISGMPYLALPNQGEITAACADGVHTIDAADHEAALGDLQVGGFRWLHSTGSDLGDITLVSAEPLPWFQLQGHSGLIEVDMDHSCEAAKPVTQAELSLTVTI